MQYRESVLADIPGMQCVRNAVKENVLSDPSLITDHDYIDYITNRGKGWVCEVNGTVVGFAVADLKENNIWALFIQPGYEGKGIGKQLHQQMLDWYFSIAAKTVWLSTAPRSRAEQFYRRAGWTEIGTYGKGEIKFEMSLASWKQLRNNNERPDEL